MAETITPQRYFESRFVPDPGRAGVWRAICKYLECFIRSDASVLDLGAGYCSFINCVRAAEKHALDIFPDFVQFAEPGVRAHVGTCDDLSRFSFHFFDVVFASNLLEHLERPRVAATLAEVRRVLKPGGRLILIQPNFRYCYREYFDDYTHVQVFTHIGLADLLFASGYEVERVEARFMPFSFKSRWPKWSWLARLYLSLPIRPWAKQMLVVGRVPQAVVTP